MDSDDEIDIYQLQNPQNPQLAEAAKKGELEKCQTVVQQWKDQRSSLHLTARDLAPALGGAVGSKHPHVVNFLLEEGAVISGIDMVLALGDTEASITMFQTFLDHGWNIDSKTNLGNTMLKHVIGNDRMTRWFLDHGADPNACGKPGSTILNVAAGNASIEIFDLLLAHGAKLEDSDALHSAAGNRTKKPGRVEMMAHLLDLGMDINALFRREHPPGRRVGRGTPLQSATGPQEVDRIMFLLERGADREVKNTLGQTPLEYAAAKGLTTSEALLRNYLKEETVESSVDSVGRESGLEHITSSTSTMQHQV